MTAGDVAVNLDRPVSHDCAKFDGVDDKITIAFAQNPFKGTLSFWMKTSKPSQAQFNGMLATNTSSVTDTFQFGFNGSGVVLFSYDEPGVNITVFSPTKNIWYHILMTYSTDANLNVWVDDSIVITSSNVGNLKALNLNFGVNRGVTKFSEVKLRDIRIYETILSATERSILTNNGNVTRSLTHQWKLDKDATDSVGSLNGSVTGAIFVNDETDIAKSIFDARANGGSSDNFLISAIGHKILTAVVEET